MKTMKILVLSGCAALGFVSTSSATYVIDGNISDWGVNLNANAAKYDGYLDTHLPAGGNDIDFVTEDNADKYDGTVFVGPGYSTGNRYDAEAMYMDNDYQYLYLAIVTGLSPAEITFPAGDIFFDIGMYQDPLSSFFDPQKYGFGIDIPTGHFYAVNSWQDVVYNSHASADPWKIGTDKTLIGDVDFVYTSDPVKSHYVMEARIPLYFMSLEDEPQADVWAHWTMLCGNDVLNLHGDVNNANAVPEPATMSLMLLGGAGLGLIRRKKSSATGA